MELLLSVPGSRAKVLEFKSDVHNLTRYEKRLAAYRLIVFSPARDATMKHYQQLAYEQRYPVKRGRLCHIYRLKQEGY